ncbi:RabGAP/TBC domain-containing protein [Tieghemostelium lacteum]|uniref:RabGAP/TBC domain-containing protein n=1 Tax=Tieghemostelium lacteum TaxID=361077 RepID=A0A151ZK41_TIELA|nr:RabGAP/TBC domain-containing protein [Tieghemostelium lacteum]|eukprot:KYQ94297.1 RabGAP/TBC domain-containing protein [Tieghemostelium lacteum]
MNRLAEKQKESDSLDDNDLLMVNDNGQPATFSKTYNDIYQFEYDWGKDSELIKELVNQKELESDQTEEWKQMIFNICFNEDDIIKIKRVFNEKSFLDLLYRGIPTAYRKTMWLIFLDCYSLDFKKDYYYSVLKDHNNAEFVYENDIINDLERTFPNHPKSKDIEFRDKIQRVLLVFSVNNPSVGYCQSLNFISFFLLMIIDNEELVFWCLCYITEKILPDYYTQKMLGSQIDQDVLSDLIKELFPELYHHFNLIGVVLPALSIEWFLCLFTTSLPAQCALIIWDNLFLRGSRVLLEVALALIEMNLDQLLQASSHAQVASILSNKPFNPQLFSTIQASYKRIGIVLSKKKLQDLKLKHWNITKTRIEKTEDEKDIKYLLKYTNFQKEKLKSLKEEFNILSHDGTGIAFLQFQQLILRFLPIWRENTDQLLLEKMFNLMDEDEDNLLNFKETVKGISTLSHGNFDQKIKFLFKLFSTNDNFLNVDELKSLINHVHTIYFKPYFKELVNNNSETAQKLKEDYLRKKQEFLSSHSGNTTLSDLKQLANEHPLILELFSSVDIDQKSDDKLPSHSQQNNNNTNQHTTSSSDELNFNPVLAPIKPKKRSNSFHLITQPSPPKSPTQSPVKVTQSIPKLPESPTPKQLLKSIYNNINNNIIHNNINNNLFNQQPKLNQNNNNNNNNNNNSNNNNNENNNNSPRKNNNLNDPLNNPYIYNPNCNLM